MNRILLSSLMVFFIEIANLLTPTPCRAQTDPASALYSAISAQTANFPIASNDVTITIGTIHADDSLPETTFTIPSQTTSGVCPPPNPPGRRPNIVPHKGARLSISSANAITPYLCFVKTTSTLTAINIHHLTIRILIDKWASADPRLTSLTVALGNLTQTVSRGTAEVDFDGDALSYDVNGVATVDFTTTSMLKFESTLDVVRPVTAAGAFVIPVLPVALVYAPPTDPNKQNSNVGSHSVSTSLTTSLSFSRQNGTTVPITANYSDVTALASDMNGLASILSLTGNPAAMGIGKALGTVSSLLGSSTATSTSTMFVGSQKGFTTSNASSLAITVNSSQGGPGDADTFLYYYDVDAVWYAKQNQLYLAILGAGGGGHAIVQNTNELRNALQSLNGQPPGAKDSTTHLDAPSIQALLSIDPFAIGGATSTPAGPRFVPAGLGTGLGSGPFTVGASTTQVTASHSVVAQDQNSAGTTTTIVHSDTAGVLSMLSFAGIAVPTTETLQMQTSVSSLTSTSVGQTASQAFNLSSDGVHSYTTQIYYDTAFDVFAFQNVANLDPQMEVAGVISNSDGTPIQDEMLIVNFGGKTYLTKTDSKGKFSVEPQKDVAGTRNAADVIRTTGISVSLPSLRNASVRLIKPTQE